MNKRRILHGKRRRRSPLRNGSGYEFNVGDYTVKSDSVLNEPTVYDSKGDVSKIGTFIARNRHKPVIRNIIDFANPDSRVRKNLRKSETFNTIKKFFPF
tara:strand:+ start:54 stop:350 length:297 start_codon:yes stop_codon:yes gene_type:complete